MTSSEDKDMSKEPEIVILGDRMGQLGIKVDDLKETFKSMVDEIHKHIERKFSDEMLIERLKLKQEISKETDVKISESIGSIKSMIKMGGWLLFLGISGTVGFTAYVANIKTNNTQPENNTRTTVQEMGELYKIISQENSKNVKQTQVIIEPERVIP